MKVDGIEIVIESDAKKACAELDKMIAKLGQASTAMQSVKGMKNASTGIKGTANSLKSYTGTANKAAKSTFSLASAFGKFYASCFLVIRGIKAIGRAISSSMDYIETYNYFNVITDKIGTEFGGAWKENGYSSAEEYANSFRDRLNEVTQKMTGFKVLDNGKLQSTDSIGLGLDPNSIMDFEATISSITNSVGLIGEVSTNTSKALTMLSADLSSLKNVDLETVMTNLQSGLIGQSRALYKYGIDITNATLQEKAFSLGIEKAVSEMTQAEKMQLRLLVILEGSRVAWGDMANTINQAANGYRVFKQQIANLARIIGDLFTPMLAKVLPYINGFVIALQRLFTWIGNILGIKWTGDSKGYGSGLGEISDDVEDLGDTLEDAEKSAKKLKRTIFGYDELNIATDPTSGGKNSTGPGIDLSNEIGDLLGEYESIWDKALSDMENKAQAIADKIIAAFKKGDYKEIGAFIGDKLRISLESIDWQKIYNVAYKFGYNFANFLNGLITPELFATLGSTIANSLNTAVKASLGFAETLDWAQMGESIASGINSFFDTFNFSELGETIHKWIQGIKELFVSAISEIEWIDVLKGIDTALSELSVEDVAIVIGAITLKYLGQVLTCTLFKEMLIKKLFGTKAVATAGDIIYNIGSKLVLTFAAVAIGYGVFEGFIYDPLMDALNADLPKEQADKAKEEYRGLTGMVKAFKEVGQATKNKISTGYFSVDGINAFNETLNSISFEGEIISDEKLKKMQEAFGYTEEQMFHLRTAMMEAHPELGTLQSQFESLGTATPETLSQIADGMVQIEGSISPAKDEATKFLQTNKDLTDEAKAFFEGISTGTTDVNDFETALENAGIQVNESFIKKLSDSIAEMRSFKKAWQEDVVAPINELWGTFSEKWDGVEVWFSENVAPWFTKEKWSNMFSNIKTSLATKWAEVVEWWKASGVFKWWTEDVSPWFTKEKWTGLYNNIKVALSDKWNEVVEWWKNSGAYKWYEENVKPLFTKEKWSFSGIKDGLSEMFDKAIESIKGSWNNFAKWLNAKLTFKIDTGNKIGQGISQLLGTSTIKLANLPTFATGGFPEDGLFRANSRELVGQFSNGKTAVVNNGQIIEGVAQGVRSAVIDGMMEVVMATSGNSSQSNNRPLQLVMDGRVVAETTYSQFETMSRQGLIPKFT